MQILSVELENVKSYEYARVEFTPGVNAIVGHNGAGKSTLLEAIGYVLFDSIEYSQSEFVRSGAKQGTARVTFISSADERSYEVVRRVGSGSQYYVFDPSLDAKVCEGKADVLRFLREHLGVPAGTNLAALFKDAVGVPQGTLTSAFLSSPTERKSLFERLLQVREYTEAVEKLREPVNLLKQRQSAIAEEIAGLEGRMARLPALQEEVAARVTALRGTQDALTRAGVELAEVQEQFSRSEAARVALEALERKVDQACQKLKSDQERVTLARQALAEAEEAGRIVAANEAGYRRYQEVQAEQARLDEQARRRAKLMDERSAADKAVALAATQEAQLAQELEKIAAAEAVAAELAAAVEEQDKLEKALAEAKQQQARLEDAKRLAAQLGDQVERLQKRLAALNEQLDRSAQIEAERRAVEARIAEYSTAVEQARAVMTDCKTRGELLKEQTAKLENIQTAVCPLCEQPLTDGHRSELLARNQEQLQTLRQSYAKAKQLLQEQETHLQEQQTAARRLQEELLRLPRPDEVDELRQEVQRAQEAHAQAQRQVEALAAAPEQAQELSRRLAELNDPRRRQTIAAEQASRRPAVEQQLAQARDRLAAERKRLDDLVQALAEFAGLDEQIGALAEELRQCQPAYQAYLTHSRAAERLDFHRQEVETYTRQAELQQQEADRLVRERDQAAAQFDAAAHQQLVERSQALQQEIGRLSAQLDMLRQTQERQQQEIAELQAMNEALSAAQARKARLVDQEAVLETVRKLLRQAGPHITTALVRQISDGARQIFSEIMQDYSRHLTWNDDYGITVNVDGHERQFAQLSGGEQMSAALAVRLALLREISDIDVAFFDEPTANLDEVRREALARQILSVRGFRQIFVISHDDTFEQATQNLVRVQRYNGVSHVQVE